LRGDGALPRRAVATDAQGIAGASRASEACAVGVRRSEASPRAAAPNRDPSPRNADPFHYSDRLLTMLDIGLTHYLILAAIVFTLGIFGIFLNRKNVIIMLMSIELMLLAVNINFVAFSSRLGLNDLVGQIFAMFVLTVAAAEAAIGLAILVVYFRNRGTIAVEDIHLMKG
jgi:NADH-quinone oxidoreductase subunit K